MLQMFRRCEEIQWVCKLCLSASVKAKENNDDKLDILLQKIISMEKQLDNLKHACTEVNIDDKIEKLVEQKVAQALDERLVIEKKATKPYNIWVRGTAW